jgi:DedD protein
MDFALKQRLLGAAVLIALAIIFVPMFLGNSPPKEASAIQNLDIPPLPERKFETRTLPVDAAAAQKPAAQATPASPDKVVTVDTKAPATFEAPEPKASESKASEKPVSALAGATAPKPATATPKEAAKAPEGPAKPAAAEPPAASVPAPSATGRFSVNLGVYVDQAHTDALVAKLVKSGFAASAEATDYQGKPARRVRVGPFADRAAAEAARLKIKQLDPKLPSSIGESAEQSGVDAPATTLAANRPGGWAVQLGAFKSEAEANKLRDRARGAGVATFVDRTGGDQTLWRVRAGPFVERSSAEAARTTLKTKLQGDGVIVTQP